MDPRHPLILIEAISFMSLHQITGKRRLGITLAFITMSVWAVLPLVLNLVLGQMDPISISWVRFSVSALMLGSVLALRGELPRLRALPRRGRLLLVLAVVALTANYLGFLEGLDRTSPTTTQVLIQLAPLMLALGGIFVFREVFSPAQWLGFVVILLGLAVFSGSQFRELVSDEGRYLIGVAFIGFAAAVWAVYGLAQKQLLTVLDTPQLMFCIFAGCAIVLTPFARPASIASLDEAGFVGLVFGSIATLVAYGCFSASLSHVEASRVSAVLALVPMGTLASSLLAHSLAPTTFPTDPISAVSIAGAGMVVVGSLVTALAGRVSEVDSRRLGE